MNHYENISSCPLNKKLSSDDGETFTLWNNMYKLEQGKAADLNNLLLKLCRILDIHSKYDIPHFYIIGKNHCAGNLHWMFLIKKSNSKCKCKHNYAEIFQVISEKLHLKYFSRWKVIYMEAFSLKSFNNK